MAKKQKIIPKQMAVPTVVRPVISVITTFYNAEKFILNAISSVATQITNNKFKIEYVIVDDKSPDSSRQLVENYINHAYSTNAISKRDIEFKVIEPEQNLGCGGARRFGINNGTGDYFMFLDADDYYINRDFMFRAFCDINAEPNTDIVEYGIIFNQANGNRQPSCVQQRMVITDMDRAALLMFKDNAIKFNVWSKIYRRSIIETYEYSAEKTFEDVRTTPRWLKNARKIVIMPSAEINYRAASGSIIREDMIKTRLGTITAMAELLPEFKHNYDIIKAIHGRAMIDIEALLSNHSSENPGFNEMSRLNTIFLQYLYPDSWKEKVFHIEDDTEQQ